jgi:adenylate cyclase
VRIGAAPEWAMQFSERTRARLGILAVVIVISGLVGIGFSWLLSELLPFRYTWREVENGARNGMLVGGTLIAFQLFYAQTERGVWLRRRRFAHSLLLRAVIYTAIIAACFLLNRGVSALFYGDAMPYTGYLGLPLLRDIVFTFVVFMLIAFVLEMRRLIGGRMLLNFLLGRYHRPRLEERVVMLIDIKGSTALAERLGDARAHAFVTGTFFEVEQAVIEHGGEVYNYVGDQMIVTWPLARGIEDAGCIRCWLAICSVLARAKDGFVTEFGAAPAVRTAIHVGPVAIGECGDARLQVVYIGDTMNVAGRLEQMTKTMDRDCLVSEEVMKRVELPDGIEAEALGALPIRGRERPLAVFALKSTSSPRASLAA